VGKSQIRGRLDDLQKEVLAIPVRRLYQTVEGCDRGTWRSGLKPAVQIGALQGLIPGRFRLTTSGALMRVSAKSRSLSESRARPEVAGRARNCARDDTRGLVSGQCGPRYEKFRGLSAISVSTVSSAQGIIAA